MQSSKHDVVRSLEAHVRKCWMCQRGYRGCTAARHLLQRARTYGVGKTAESAIEEQMCVNGSLTMLAKLESAEEYGKRLHVVATRTGRLSSSVPNTQRFPAAPSWGRTW